MGLIDYLSITPAAVTQANKIAGIPTPPIPASKDKAALPDFEKASPINSKINHIDEINKKGLFGFFKDYYKKPDFEAEEKRAKKQRSLALIGDIANLGLQSISSAMGARRFEPIQSQVPKYNERLQRLRDAKKDYDIDYNNKSLSMIFRDYEQKRADEQRYRQLEDAAKKDKYNQEWDRYKFDTDLNETIRHNQEMEKASIMRASRPVSGSSKKATGNKRTGNKEDYVNVYDNAGNLKQVPARLITVNDYWKYAKNSLIRDGKLKSTANDHELYKAMKDGDAYSNPAIKELISKVGSRLFPSKQEHAKNKRTIPGFGASNQGHKKIDSF